MSNMTSVIKVNGSNCTLSRFNSANRSLSIVSPAFGPGIIYLDKGTAKRGMLNYRDYDGKYRAVEVQL